MKIVDRPAELKRRAVASDEEVAALADTAKSGKALIVGYATARSLRGSPGFRPEMSGLKVRWKVVKRGDSQRDDSEYYVWAEKP